MIAEPMRVAVRRLRYDESYDRRYSMLPDFDRNRIVEGSVIE